MSCITPRAPTQLFAVALRPLSAKPCALKYFQSNAGPKYRLVYFRNVGSYRSLIFLSARACAARSSALVARVAGASCACAAIVVATQLTSNATPTICAADLTLFAPRCGPAAASSNRATDDERNGQEQRGNEDRHGDV